MKFPHLIALASLALLLPAAGASAQEAVKVGVCNPAKVFESMDERKVIEDRMKGEREKAQQEVARRKQKVEDLQRQRNELKEGSAIFQEKYARRKYGKSAQSGRMTSAPSPSLSSATPR